MKIAIVAIAIVLVAASAAAAPVKDYQGIDSNRLIWLLVLYFSGRMHRCRRYFCQQ